ncbi:MAG: ABC transporter ATP-binding protein [Spirochaetota bacterium]
MPFELRGITRRFGGHEVLAGIDLSIEKGAMVVILGPSGCGKTTLLRIVAGLDPEHGGTRLGFDQSRFSYAFQEPRLLPWLSVLDNARYALSGSGLPPAEATDRIMRLVSLAGLAGHEQKRPAELSGGMRQRASLVRAFAYPNDFLLLDEAFQSVDLRLRRELIELFLDLRALEDNTALLVTHDPTEALLVADRVVILSDRPARVLDDFMIPSIPIARTPGSPELAAFEQRIYRSVLG